MNVSLVTAPLTDIYFYASSSSYKMTYARNVCIPCNTGLEACLSFFLVELADAFTP
jgi:hypothetical protein